MNLFGMAGHDEMHDKDANGLTAGEKGNANLLWNAHFGETEMHHIDDVDGRHDGEEGKNRPTNQPIGSVHIPEIVNDQLMQ